MNGNDTIATLIIAVTSFYSISSVADAWARRAEAKYGAAGADADDEQEQEQSSDTAGN